MIGKQHLTFGLVTATATMVTADIFNCSEYYGTFAQFVALAGVGSLFADIDMPNSTISKLPILHQISKLIYKLFGHRTITHDIAIILPLAFVSVRLNPTAMGFWFGYFTHLFLDALNPEGLPFLFKKRKIHLTPKKMKIYTTDTEVTSFVTGFFSVLYCGGCYLLCRMV